MNDIKKELTKRYIKDIKSADVWSVFKIIADFVKGFDELGDLGPAVQSLVVLEQMKKIFITYKRKN
jgi:hypothetical protein